MNSKRFQPVRIRFQRMLLSGPKLKDEVFVAFGLLAVVFLVLIGYVFPGTASWFHERGSLPLVILIAGVICFLGFLVIIQIIEPIIKISRHAQLIAQGDLNRTIELRREDEIGELGLALNTMTRRIRENVEELKNLSQVAETLNMEINGKIGMLSSLMDISNSIAQNFPLEKIIRTALRNCLQRHDMTVGLVIFKDRATHDFRIAASEGVRDSGSLEELRFRLGEGLVGQLILKQQVEVIDRSSAADRAVSEFLKTFGICNAIFAPISTKGNAYGILVTGNARERFAFSPGHKELIPLMAKHLAIAAFNDEMSREMERRVEADPLTGLFSQAYARGKLQDEVNRSLKEQRPCSFILIGFDRFDNIREKLGPYVVQEALVKTSEAIKGFLHGNDIAARFGESEFAMILPGRNKREAMGLALALTRKISDALDSQEGSGQRLKARAAVVENPIDGMTADELILKSGIILNETGDGSGNRVGHKYHS